jgi:hypothetical protein
MEGDTSSGMLSRVGNGSESTKLQQPKTGEKNPHSIAKITLNVL